MAENINSARWLAFLVALTMCSCQSNRQPELIDASLITQLPCAPPCWHGLTPGTTDADTALAFLQSSPLVAGNIGERFGTPATGSYSQWWWWVGTPQEPEHSNSLQFDSQHILSRISLELNARLTVKELVAVYGSPISVMFGIHGPRGFIPTNPVGVAVTALFHGDRLAVTWFERTDVSADPVRYCPDVGTLLDTVEYYDQVLADHYLNQFEEVRLTATTGGIVLPGDSLLWIAVDTVETICIDIAK